MMTKIGILPKKCLQLTTEYEEFSACKEKATNGRKMILIL